MTDDDRFLLIGQLQRHEGIRLRDLFDRRYFSVEHADTDDLCSRRIVLDSIGFATYYDNVSWDISERWVYPVNCRRIGSDVGPIHHKRHSKNRTGVWDANISQRNSTWQANFFSPRSTKAQKRFSMKALVSRSCQLLNLCFVSALRYANACFVSIITGSVGRIGAGAATTIVVRTTIEEFGQWLYCEASAAVSPAVSLV